MLIVQQAIAQFLADEGSTLSHQMTQAPIPKWDVDGFRVNFLRPYTSLYPVELAAYKLAILLLLRGRMSRMEFSDIVQTFAVAPNADVSFSWMGAPDLLAARSYVQGVVEQSVENRHILALIHSIVTRAQEALPSLDSQDDIQFVQNQLSQFA